MSSANERLPVTPVRDDGLKAEHAAAVTPSSTALRTRSTAALISVPAGRGSSSRSPPKSARSAAFTLSLKCDQAVAVNQPVWSWSMPRGH